MQAKLTPLHALTNDARLCGDDVTQWLRADNSGAAIRRRPASNESMNALSLPVSRKPFISSTRKHHLLMGEAVPIGTAGRVLHAPVLSLFKRFHSEETAVFLEGEAAAVT